VSYEEINEYETINTKYSVFPSLFCANAQIL